MLLIFGYEYTIRISTLVFPSIIYLRRMKLLFRDYGVLIMYLFVGVGGKGYSFISYSFGGRGKGFFIYLRLFRGFGKYFLSGQFFNRQIEMIAMQCQSLLGVCGGPDKGLFGLLSNSFQKDV
jgi:hypothetical protein